MASHWLVKSEPDTYSYADLERDGRTIWDGVRNFAAASHLKSMKVGDQVFFYHSNCAVPGIVGIARVASQAYPDPTQFDPQSDYFDPRSPPEAPRWQVVDIAFERRLPRTIRLDELRRHAAALGDFPLLARGNRLSVLPVTQAQWNAILALA